MKPERAQSFRNGKVVTQVGESRIETMLGRYKPSWFYFNSLLANCSSLLIESDPIDYETMKVKSRSKVGGEVVYDYIRSR